MRPKKSSILACVLCILALASYGQSQGATGSEIAEKAKTANLVRANAISAEKGGKKVKFTPINFDNISTTNDLDGKVVGVLETELTGESLPPGSYHIYLAKSGSEWHAYAESGQNIVKEADRVEINQTQKPAGNKKPKITFGTFHVCAYDEWVCIYF